MNKIEKKKIDLSQVKKYKELAVADKQGKWGLISKIMRYCLPNEATWENEKGTLGDQTRGIYDSTAVIKSSKLARKLTTMFFPTNLQWGGLAGEEDEEAEIRETLQNYGEIVFNVIQSSNLNKEALPFIQNWSTAGTGGIRLIYTKDDNEPINFKQLPLKNLYFIEDGKGRPQNTFFKSVQVTRDTIMSTWKDAELPSDWDEVDTKRDIFECSIVHDDGMYTYLVTNEAMDEIYVQRELNYNPFIVPRYMKSGDGSSWGFGAGAQCLSSIINANLSAYLKRGYGKMGIKSPMLLFTSEENLANIQKTKIELGKWSYMGAVGQTAVQPFTPSVNPNAEFINLEDDKLSIGEAFYDSYITRRMKEAVKTATEWNYEFADFMEVFSANYNMFEDEALVPIFMGVYKILMSINYQGMSEDNLKSESEESKLKVVPKFINKLTENEKVEKIENTNQFLVNLTQQFGLPATLIMNDIPQVIDNLREWYNVPQDWKPGKESDKLLQAYINQLIKQGLGMGGGEGENTG